MKVVGRMDMESVTLQTTQATGPETMLYNQQPQHKLAFNTHRFVLLSQCII